MGAWFAYREIVTSKDEKLVERAKFAERAVDENFGRIKDFLAPVCGAERASESPAIVFFDPDGDMLDLLLAGRARREPMEYLNVAWKANFSGSLACYDPCGTNAIYVRATGIPYIEAEGPDAFLDTIAEETAHAALGKVKDMAVGAVPKKRFGKGTYGDLGRRLGKLRGGGRNPVARVDEFYARLGAKMVVPEGSVYTPERLEKEVDYIEKSLRFRFPPANPEDRQLARMAIWGLAEHLPAFAAETLCDGYGGPENMAKELHVFEYSPAALMEEVVFPAKR